MSRTNKIRNISMLIAISLITMAISAYAEKPLVTSASHPIFSYPLDSEALIISYSSTPEMLGNPDKTPRIQVFGDGRVLVHYPFYMKKAGDYEVYLNRGEIRQLLLALSGVFDFDQKVVKQLRKAIKAAREEQEGVIYYRSEDTLEQIEVRLNEYQESSVALAQKVNMKLSWKNIASDAKDYPNVTAIQRLAGARQSIRALLKRDDLLLVEVEPISRGRR